MIELININPQFEQDFVRVYNQVVQTLSLPKKIKVIVTGVDEQEIRTLNKETRNIDKTYGLVNAVPSTSLSNVESGLSKGEVLIGDVVYNDPKNLFVARFIGSPTMNFFEGTYENGQIVLKNPDMVIPVGENFVIIKIVFIHSVLNQLFQLLYGFHYYHTFVQMDRELPRKVFRLNQFFYCTSV